MFPSTQKEHDTSPTRHSSQTNPKPSHLLRHCFINKPSDPDNIRNKIKKKTFTIR